MKLLSIVVLGLGLMSFTGCSHFSSKKCCGKDKQCKTKKKHCKSKKQCKTKGKKCKGKKHVKNHDHSTCKDGQCTLKKRKN